ncbi:hypothetical protein Tco_1120388, partial [Tanacetum coccineum]
NVMGDALSRKERVKSRRVRGMNLAAESEAFNQENVLAERLHGLDQQMERKGDESAAKSVRDAMWFKNCLASSSGWTSVLHLKLCMKGNVGRLFLGRDWESSLTGLELVKEMSDNVVLVKEKLKAARDRQKSYVDFRHKPLECEVGDHVLLKVSPWKGVVRFGKKGKLAPRYVGPFEILERIGLVAYRLRIPEELNSVHDTFYVSN